MIKSYILKRKNLVCLFVLIDSRIPAQQADIDFMYWLGINSVPFSIVFTKSDKISTRVLNSNFENFCKVLSETWEKLPSVIITSSHNRKGKDTILEYIGTLVNPK